MYLEFFTVKMKYKNKRYKPELIDFATKLLDPRDYKNKYGIFIIDILERYLPDVKLSDRLRMYIEDKPFNKLLNDYKSDKLYFYHINEDTYEIEETVIKVDIHRGDLYWEKNTLEECPLIVDGYFDCDWCGLTSLMGCPIVVTSSFSCSGNSLISLKYCPVYVGYSFYCHHNYLTDLQYCPKNINDTIYCYKNSLTTLKYAPEKVKGKFNCECNPDLPKEEIERYRNSGSVLGDF